MISLGLSRHLAQIRFVEPRNNESFADGCDRFRDLTLLLFCPRGALIDLLQACNDARDLGAGILIDAKSCEVLAQSLFGPCPTPIAGD